MNGRLPLLGFLLVGFRWYRRWSGGHWELWQLDSPVHGESWHQVPACSQKPVRVLVPATCCLDAGTWQERLPDRPTSLCRGTPRCEDWPAGPRVEVEGWTDRWRDDEHAVTKTVWRS